MEKYNRLYFCLVDTDSGWIGIVASKNGLTEVILPRSSSESVRQAILEKYNIVNRDASSFFGTLPQRLKLYFKGRHVDFPDVLDFSAASDFQRSVWEKTRTIPYGETRSYNWIACETGYAKAARAVGNALGKNPYPIIVPCHRVIRSNGRLGGFTGGIEVKKRLLQLETGIR